MGSKITKEALTLVHFSLVVLPQCVVWEPIPFPAALFTAFAVANYGCYCAAYIFPIAPPSYFYESAKPSNYLRLLKKAGQC